MKLLFDHNLSRKLVTRLADLFPDSNHVALIGLDRAEDLAIWSFARGNGYMIVTKDSDFNDVSILRGVPPKIIWLRIGNCTTTQIEHILRNNVNTIHAFITHPTNSILEIVS